MVMISGLVTGSIISPPPTQPPTPWPNKSGGGDSKYVSGLLKHINNQNEETVNPLPVRRKLNTASKYCGNDNAVGNVVIKHKQNAQLAQLLLDFGCFGPNLLDMVCAR